MDLSLNPEISPSLKSYLSTSNVGSFYPFFYENGSVWVYDSWSLNNFYIWKMDQNFQKALTSLETQKPGPLDFIDEGKLAYAYENGKLVVLGKNLLLI